VIQDTDNCVGAPGFKRSLWISGISLLLCMSVALISAAYATDMQQLVSHTDAVRIDGPNQIEPIFIRVENRVIEDGQPALLSLSMWPGSCQSCVLYAEATSNTVIRNTHGEPESLWILTPGTVYQASAIVHESTSMTRLSMIVLAR